MSKEMLINNLQGQECRIAIVEDGQLQELYIERSSSSSHVGNIYKGRITNIEPGIQAAFVDFGIGKNGFLHISDVRPQYFSKGHDAAIESVGRKRPEHSRPPVQQFFKRGQEVVVQVTKEGIGTKGPTLTTYLSIPGRFLVMMPGMSRLGVSRKIEDEEIRAKVRAMLNELKVPDSMGFIVRTAGMDSPKRELQRDLNYLLRLWKSVERRIEASQAPAAIYQESDLVIRTIRDIYNSDVKRVICDRQADARKVREFVNVVMPRKGNVIEVYTGKEGLFHDAGLEEEIEGMYARRVNLPSGGSLVIDQTEALVAIDINSGRMREHSNSEDTARKTNVEAATEIGRQLRIRDMGGMVVIDFIDMMNDKHRHEVEKALKDAIKPDRAKSKILRMSQFGLVEMTRQRMRPSLKQSIYRPCKHCDGTGVVKSEQSQTIHVMRALQALCADEDVAAMRLSVPLAVAADLNNEHRRQLHELEDGTGKDITINGQADLHAGDLLIEYTDRRGNTVAWSGAEKRKGGKQKRRIDTINVDQLSAKRVESAGPTGKTDLAEKADQPVRADVLVQDLPEEKPKAKRPRRRGRRGGQKHKTANGQSPAAETPEAASADQPTTSAAPKAAEAPPKAEANGTQKKTGAQKKKRSSRRRKSTRKSAPPVGAEAAKETPSDGRAATEEAAPPEKPESSGFASAADELAEDWPLG